MVAAAVPSSFANDDAVRQDWLVDIHCHCLPAVDDGPATMAQSLQLCRLLAAEGITHAIAAPHQLGRYHAANSPGQIRQEVAALNSLLHLQQIALTVLPGGDVRIDERLPRLLADDQVLTLADGRRYVMLELPHEIYVDPRALLDQLNEAGYVSILSHPERHYHIQRDFRCVLHCLERHAVLQITAGSVMGDFGPAAQHCAWDLLSAGYAAVVATDAHDAVNRPPRLSAAAGAIAARLGPALSRLVCRENAQRLVAGLDVLPPARMQISTARARAAGRPA